jgi:hypothetical protein
MNIYIYIYICTHIFNSGVCEKCASVGRSGVNKELVRRVVMPPLSPSFEGGTVTEWTLHPGVEAQVETHDTLPPLSPPPPPLLLPLAPSTISPITSTSSFANCLSQIRSLSLTRARVLSLSLPPGV